MKAFASIALIGLLSLFCFTGCAADNTQGPADDRFGLNEDPINAQVIMDDVTGVHYLVLSKDGAIAVAPILNPDGTPSRVDDADMDDVRADIEANNRSWIQGLLAT